MNLQTSYLGFQLKNPIIPSAGPLTEQVDRIKRLEDAGAAAVVMHSLFEEQLQHESHQLDHYLEYGAESFAEAVDYFPEAEEYHVGPEQYLRNIRAAKDALDIPLIGSLNGSSPGGWTEYAREIQDAGADALELNIYHLPTEPEVSGTMVEDRYLTIVKEVTTAMHIPVAVKIGAQFSSIPHMAAQLAEAGASALVMFNRFYQPDIDLAEMQVLPKLVLSNSNELRLPLRWVAILFGRVDTDFAITGGVHNSSDVIKCMMAGAHVAMMTSELLQNGINRISEILEGIEQWMEENEYESIEQMQGSMSQIHVADGEAFERANYQKTLQSWRPDPMGRFD